MAFFPPSLSPNNKAFITDDKFVQEGGLARFAPRQQECVVYWPWLSWNEIDVAVGPDQRCIPRCTLIGDSIDELKSQAADSVGAIFRFGTEFSGQAWELMHHFDWHDRDNAVKKFAVCWFRPWFGLAPAPPVTIVGGIDAASAAPIDPGIVYITTAPVASAPVFFDARELGGPIEVEFQPLLEGTDGRMNLFHSYPTSPTWFQTLYPGKQAVPMPAPGLAISIWAQGAQEPTQHQFRVVGLPGAVTLPGP